MGEASPPVNHEYLGSHGIIFGPAPPSKIVLIRPRACGTVCTLKCGVGPASVTNRPPCQPLFNIPLACPHAALGLPGAAKSNTRSKGRSLNSAIVCQHSSSRSITRSTPAKERSKAGCVLLVAATYEAPARFSSCTKWLPTPPVPPITSTRSPSRTQALAVSSATVTLAGTAAASTIDISAGFSPDSCVDTAVYSASPP
eukprot:scaffold39729_cov63-Phaeocystis_antarctica.AAC.12